MAEGAAILSSAVTQFASLVAQEAIFLSGIEEQVTELLKELETIRSFLKDAEPRPTDREVVRRCINEARDRAYDIEDIIETYNLKIAAKRRPGCRNYFKRYACILRETWRLHRIKSQMEKLSHNLKNLNRKFQEIGLGPMSDAGGRVHTHDLRTYPHTPVENQIVGLHVQIQEMTSVLVGETHTGANIFSICGMAGTGKTTLAKILVQNAEIIGHFQNRVAWAYVSPFFKKEDIWEDILNSLGVPVDCRTTQELSRKLYGFLRDNQCLVVLDDIWSTKAWDDLKHGFPLEPGSQTKFLLTSRNREVATHGDGQGFLLDLKCLGPAESWDLFKSIAFPATARASTATDSERNRKELLGKEMAERCDGLPLAITVLGRILASDGYASYEKWEKVHRDVRSYIRGLDTKVEDILTLSYDNLPYQLKPCFLYLAYFPKEYEMDVGKLIKMWIAEGFLSHVVGQETMEDVAEQYFIEFLQRGMILEVKRSPDSSRIKTCRMHDIMRDFCMTKARQEDFLYLFDRPDEDNSPRVTPISVVRRLTMCGSFRILGVKNPRLRSFMYFSDNVRAHDAEATSSLSHKIAHHLQDRRRRSSFKDFALHVFLLSVLLLITGQSMAAFFCNFKKIRVLDLAKLELIGCRTLSDIHKLIHLRYLSLADARLLRLPCSLGRLRCLQTLDLRVDCEAFPIKVPDVLWQMYELRHLYLPKRCTHKTRLRLGTLVKLQTLVNCPTNNCAVEEICGLANLRELRMHGALKDTEDDNLSKHFACFLHTTSSHEFGSGDGTSSSYWGLDHDPMPLLDSKLPYLRILALEGGAFVGKKLEFSAGAFPQLESLILSSLPELEEITVDPRSIVLNPSHARFLVSDCPKLQFNFSYIPTILLQILAINPSPLLFSNSSQQQFLHQISLALQHLLQLNRGKQNGC